MLSTERLLTLCLWSLALLAASPLAQERGGWKCVESPGGTGWSCSGEGTRTKKPSSRPTADASSGKQEQVKPDRQASGKRAESPRRASSQDIKSSLTEKRPKSVATSPAARTGKATSTEQPTSTTDRGQAGQTARQDEKKPKTSAQQPTAQTNPTADSTQIRKQAPKETGTATTGSTRSAGTTTTSKRTAKPAQRPSTEVDGKKPATQSNAAKQPSAGGDRPQPPAADRAKKDGSVEKAAAKQDAAASAATQSPSAARKKIDTGPLHAGLPWEYCGPRPARLGPAVLRTHPGEQDLLYVSAYSFGYDQKTQILSLNKDVELDHGSWKIKADEMTYNRENADVKAAGNAYFAYPGVRIVGSKADMNLKSDKGNLYNTHYRLIGPTSARGSADRAEMLNPKLTHFENITYTACRPGQNDWELEASKLELDQTEGVGVARHAKLRVGGIPVLYTPYLSFPIDDRRKTGVLVPSVGSSDDRGIEVTVPYYVNIAPNMDATLFPRVMSKRGLMLGAEFRFLTSRQEGEVYGEILPRDNEFEDNATRSAIRLEHKGRYGKGWSSDVNFNAVSDDEYLEDFGNSLEVTSVRNIERRGDLTYSGKGWSLLTRLQEFQTVDASIPVENRPYKRLPQLLLKVAPRQLGPGVQLGVHGDYNYFDHDEKTRGHRVAFQPYASLPLRRSYGHLIPKINLYLGTYDLHGQETDQPESPSYFIPSFNLDGKLVFERTIDWLDQSSLQTLEPRLYYLYTAYEDQDDIPVFDSSELTFSFNSLFRENRFTGRDRIGDANQLTLGLTSRTLAMDSGVELFRASIGQILYFRDRDVQISGAAEDTDSSAIAGELAARFLPNWSGRASFQWDPNKDEDQSEKRVLELHYQTPENHLVNLAYRFDLGQSESTRYEDTDIAFRWPVNPQLNLVGRWYYSLLQAQTLEALAGIEYGRCCWRLRLVGRHLKNNSDSDGNTTVMVQVELAGLGSLGQRVDRLLERDIYGYHAE